MITNKTYGIGIYINLYFIALVLLGGYPTLPLVLLAFVREMA